MPEGDTIHQIAATLRPYLSGKMLLEAAVGREAEGRLAGSRVEEVFAHGKHLFLVLSRGVVVRSHLGMHGTWHVYRPGEAWRKPASQASLVLRTERHVLVCFDAKEVEVMRREGLRMRDALRRLGPDLLADEVDLDEVVRRAGELCGPDAAVVDVLLDQRPASGIGNVTKCEALFLAGVHPGKRLGELGDAGARRLFATARELLRANRDGGPRRTREGDPPHWVYERSGKPCLRCGTRLAYAKLGRDLRGTTWCPTCQPEG